MFKDQLLMRLKYIMQPCILSLFIALPIPQTLNFIITDMIFLNKLSNLCVICTYLYYPQLTLKLHKENMNEKVLEYKFFFQFSLYLVSLRIHSLFTYITTRL